MALTIPAILVTMMATGPGSETALPTSPPVAASETANDPADQASDITVTGRAEKLYRVEETSSGKLPTEPLASSQSISVVTDQLIRDQGARDAKDLYRNLSGVSVFSYAGVTARGFRQQENFYDGLRGDPYVGFAVPQLFNFERVEFLKGPAGMLYGQTAPGGLFNYVTRKPTPTFSAELRGIVGTRDRFGGSAEVNGRVAGPLSGRVGVFYERRDTFRLNADSEVLVLDGGLATDLGFGRLILQGTHYEQDLGGNRLRGVPVDNAGNFYADRRWNHNEASDFLRLRSTVAQARLEGGIGDAIRFDLTARYINAREAQQYHEPSGLIDANADGVPEGVTREFRDQVRDYETWSFGGNLVWSARIGGIANRVLLGADHYRSDELFDYFRARGAATARPNLPTPLSFADPAYGITNPRGYALTQVSLRQPSRATRSGLYLLEEATIGPVILTAGIRYDDFDDRSGATSAAGDAWTYRAGAVWRITPEISLFGQYATSFEPQGIGAQDPRAGGPFAPVTGDIFEGGIKTGLMNGRVQASLAVYQIRRRNVLQADPRGDPEGDGIDNSVAFGEVTSKGVDLDIAADITPDWVVTLAYAYNDTRITRDNGRTAFTNAVGNRFANAPEHQLGFWTRYQFRPTGFAVAIGGDYMSERLSLSNQRVKPYMVFDASIIWERGPWRALVRIDNLFDKTYASSGFTDRTGHFPGEPRSAFLEVSHRF